MLVLTGETARDWKMANVTPIFEKGDKFLSKNYSPINLTSAVGKFVETITRDKIVNYLEENRSINGKQHNFRRNFSNLLDFL